jgi:hypothetical protein
MCMLVWAYSCKCTLCSVLAQLQRDNEAIREENRMVKLELQGAQDRLKHAHLELEIARERNAAKRSEAKVAELQQQQHQHRRSLHRSTSLPPRFDREINGPTDPDHDQDRDQYEEEHSYVDAVVAVEDGQRRGTQAGYHHTNSISINKHDRKAVVTAASGSRISGDGGTSRGRSHSAGSAGPIGRPPRSATSLKASRSSVLATVAEKAELFDLHARQERAATSADQFDREIIAETQDDLAVLAQKQRPVYYTLPVSQSFDGGSRGSDRRQEQGQGQEKGQGPTLRRSYDEVLLKGTRGVSSSRNSVGNGSERSVDEHGSDRGDRDVPVRRSRDSDRSQPVDSQPSQHRYHGADVNTSFVSQLSNDNTSVSSRQLSSSEIWDRAQARAAQSLTTPTGTAASTASNGSNGTNTSTSTGRYDRLKQMYDRVHRLDAVVAARVSSRVIEDSDSDDSL